MKLSVIVPVFNTEKYLDQCIKSIINQSLKSIEIILVDDGSPDNAGKLCDDYANKYENIIVIHKNNEGLGMARNAGLKVATGEYVAFLDSDDYVDEFYYENLFNLCEKYNLDICVSGGINIFNSLNQKNVLTFDNNNKLYNTPDEIKNIIPNLIGNSIGKNDGGVGSACFSLYRKSLIDNNNIQFVSERTFMSEDIWFSIDIYNVCNKMFISDVCGYFYRYNENSLSRSYNPNRIHALIKSVQMLKDKCVSYNMDNYEERLAVFFWVNFEKCINQEVRFVNKKQAKKNIKHYIEDKICAQYLKVLSSDNNFKGIHAYLCRLLHRGHINIVYTLLRIYNKVILRRKM